MAEAEEKAARVRSLLSSYYGTGGGDGGGAGGPGGAPPPAPRSPLDAASFDAGRFVGGLLRELPLPELLRRHTELAKEIEELDGDMQTLVYENYSKFISATDTIRDMTGDVAGMRRGMSELEAAVGAVAERSAGVNATLAARRANIDELNGVRALLRQVRVLFDLPGRLRAALDNDAPDVAAEYWAQAAPVLRRQAEGTALAAVWGRAQGTREEICAALKRRMSREKAEAGQCIQLLQQLGEPVESLRGEYLEGSLVKLSALLINGRQSVLPGGAAAGGAGTGAAGRLGDLGSAWWPAAAAAASGFLELFPDARPDLEAGLEPLVVDLLALSEEILLRSPPEDFAEALRGLIEGPQQLDEALPSAGLPRKVDALARNLLSRQAEAHFQSASGAVAQGLRRAEAAGGGPALEESLGSLCKEIGDSVSAAVQGAATLEALGKGGVVADEDWRREFVGAVFRHSAELHRAVQAHMEDSAESVEFGVDGGVAAEGSRAGQLLLLAKFASHLAAVSVDETADLLSVAFPAERPFEVREAKEAFKTMHQSLLQRYVAFRGRDLSRKIQLGVRSMEQLVAAGAPPGKPLPFCESLLEALTAADGEVTQLVDAVGSRKAAPPGHRRDHSTHSDPTEETHRLQRNLDKLFREKLRIFSDRVEETQSALLGGTVNIALKSLVESIRLATFNREQLQQMQVNIAFLRARIGKFSEDEAVSFLLDEALASAGERSLDPALLSGAEVDALLAPARGA